MKELATNSYTFAEFELDLTRRVLLRDGHSVPLHGKAFDLLVVLIENRDRVIAKDELMEMVWRDQFVEEANLTVQVSALRKALQEKKDEHRFIVTVPGRGYRFVADVQNGQAPPDIIISTHTSSHLLVDEEVVTPVADRPGDALYDVRARSNRYPRLPYVIVALATASLIGLGLAYGIYFLTREKSARPFEKINQTRLTNSGRVSRAGVSPDGKYIAYVLGENEGNSLWLQQVGTASTVRLLAPVKAQVYELTFNPDGSYIFYNLFADGSADPQFFRIPSLGGVSEQIPNVIASYISFAPDGKRFAYAQSDSAGGKNHLVIADADGRNQKTVAERPYPNTFETQMPVVAWSPDGETIACLVHHVEAGVNYSSIVGINARDGSEKTLGEQRWYDVLSIEWLKNGSGLLFSASDKLSGPHDIRFLSYPRGESRQITNDLSHHDSLSITADGESLVSIETNTVNGIYVGEVGANPDKYQVIISETGALYPFVWTPDGKIIYRSNKDGVANLWTMDATGEDRRQLTTNAQVDSRGLCISPDGKHLVFGSSRNGRSNLWRVDADGRNLMQLTTGEVDVYPSCSPDNLTVVYQKGLHSGQRLWKVHIKGGESVQLTDSYSKWSAISNDGYRISYFFMADDKWRFGIISSAGGAMLQRLDVPASLKEYATRWSPDNQSLLFISTIGDVGNIWALPLDGSSVKPLTNFTSHSIADFSLSQDGKHLAVSRVSSSSDAVLISNVR